MTSHQRAALISVSDKTGLVDIAKFLQSEGFVLLSTKGTGSFLSEHGVTVTSIEEYTGQKEFLDGRVKTLHPRIHGGLLARRDSEAHMRQLLEAETLAIDVALVNLYPFLEAFNSKESKTEPEMVELIDIGGPTMIRAAAKNFSSVYPVIDPSDYPRLQEILRAE
ncbi:MAG: hypothetical protein KDD64_04860, partial [Bdellovibrionales bacterium]|nr:hypothetical protein [Bdellovibrionales bacterium]